MYSVSKLYKRQFLTRPKVLTVLLEYIDFSTLEWQHEVSIRVGLPCPYHFYCYFPFSA